MTQIWDLYFLTKLCCTSSNQVHISLSVEVTMFCSFHVQNLPQLSVFWWKMWRFWRPSLFLPWKILKVACRGTKETLFVCSLCQLPTQQRLTHYHIVKREIPKQEGMYVEPMSHHGNIFLNKCSLNLPGFATSVLYCVVAVVLSFLLSSVLSVIECCDLTFSLMLHIDSWLLPSSQIWPSSLFQDIPVVILFFFYAIHR